MKKKKLLEMVESYVDIVLDQILYECGCSEPIDTKDPDKKILLDDELEEDEEVCEGCNKK